MKEGKIKEIIGVVVDVDFGGQELPSIYNALEVPGAGSAPPWQDISTTSSRVNERGARNTPATTSSSSEPAGPGAATQPW